jgi:chitinase
MPTGLTQDGVNLLTNTKSHNVNVSVVNVMAMDYGGADGSMGQDAINATVATHAQVQAAGLSANMGCTPMIGQNDSSGEIFSLADAQTLVNWANGTSYVSRLAFWSVGRDNGGCAGSGSASPSCSGVSQSNYQFSGIFKGF